MTSQTALAANTHTLWQTGQWKSLLGTKFKKYFLKVCFKWGNFNGFWRKHDLLSSFYKEADGIKFIFILADTAVWHIHSLKGLQLTFPIDNSFSGCYKDRQSCLDRDMPSEVGISDQTDKLYSDFSLRLITLWPTFSPLEPWLLTGLDFRKQ